MGKVLDIDHEFEQYFHELEAFALRSERFDQDLDLISDLPKPQRLEFMQAWLHAAFCEGAKRMAEDMLAALGDYACAVSGTEQDPKYKTEQCFDIAQENLESYVNQVFLDKTR